MDLGAPAIVLLAVVYGALALDLVRAAQRAFEPPAVVARAGSRHCRAPRPLRPTSRRAAPAPRRAA